MEINKLQLASIYLKNFRCFEQTTIDLDSHIVLICGLNGTGKTSLLEALYYGCYLRSFRTHLSRDLIALGKESFFIKFLIHDYSSSENFIDHTIQIGFTDNKRLVKIDNKPTVSYKDLLTYYRIVSLTEDDLKLVQDGPEERRSFLDQALLLKDTSFINMMREYRIVLENRNALLCKDKFDQEMYFLWTKKLWEYTSRIQKVRKQLLLELETEVNIMLHRHVDEHVSISFVYQAKKNSDNAFDIFWNNNISSGIMRSELHLKRTLFGAHIDDFTIMLQGKQSRAHSSRGQQKMIVLLIKIAQIKQLSKANGPIIFLLDDFMTDFDIERGKALLSALFELNCQLIFTSPRRDSALESALIASQYNYKIISI
ncbi:MAG TPA: DNA replication and repair protein RecF [Candidatus Babeliales bacterium]|nr:DNA replication and repair protein RecF [Candidatus Babeliales bacterium]